MSEDADKRKYRRVKSRFDIKIKTSSGESRVYNVEVGRSRDLSACGVLMKYNKDLSLGEIVSITFLKPNSFEFFEGNARVVRSEYNPDDRSYDIGVEFINLSIEDEKKLDYCLLKAK
jgi:c-di-GMP-binding flagellar brake protein YcgR